MTQVILRVHLVHLMNVEQCQVAAKPSDQAEVELVKIELLVLMPSFTRV